MPQPKQKDQEKEKQRNKKAFTFSGGTISNKKKMQRLGDLQAKRDRKTVIDKTPQNEGPPYVVVVQGPPGVGKTTLIRSLVKHYSKTTLGQDIDGPVTLVSGRVRRLTFIECPANDMRAMLDLGKVADLVLLMVDGSRQGFEMETFEFINILQVHGFPRVIGILTHLDGFKETKRLRKTKKSFKQRFWTELYDGAKMFYLSGLQYGNRYNKTEIVNLARFVSVQRFPPLTWRQTHPYLLGLRCEVNDETTPEKLQVSIYGYVCGARLRQGQLAHIPGLGDYSIDKVEAVVDPCPLPQHVQAAEKGGAVKDFGKATGAPLRSLADKHKSIYAPYCDAEHVAVEKDAMYITLRNHSSHFTKSEKETKKSDESTKKGDDESSCSWSSSDEGEEEGEAVRMVRELQQIKSATVEESDSGDEELQFIKNGVSVKSRIVPDDVASDSSESSEDEDFDELEPSTNPSLLRFQSGGQSEDLNALVYGSKRGSGKSAVRTSIGEGSKKLESLFSDNEDSEDEDVFGEFDEDDNRRRVGDIDDESDVDALTERLRRTKVFSAYTLAASNGKPAKAVEQDDDESDDEDDSEDENADDKFENERSQNSKDKAGKAAAAASADPSEEAAEVVYRHRLEGTGGVVSSVASLREEGAFDIGQFVKVTFLNIPADFAKPLSTPSRPLIVGGLPAGSESRHGSEPTQHLLSIKRHRWSPKILKNLDPVLVSAGWRRFQSVPLYSIEDRDGKQRMLKYTPEHMHCFCMISAPVIPPTTGVMFIRDWRAVPNYRVSATGLVVEGAEKIKVLKKIKLVGSPFKVHDKTAFIKGMFNSDLEVEKCLHSKIQTVSGIVGEIKKPHKDAGDFRATFGHKIQMSDLVMLKAWVPVEAPAFCNPMIDLDIWPRLRTINEIRRDTSTPIPHKADSSYGVAKQDRSGISNKFAKIRVPTKVMEKLPFKSRTQVLSKKPKSVKAKEAKDIERGAGPIVLPGSSMEDKRETRKVRAVIHGLNVVRRTRIEAKKEKSKEKKELKLKREKFIQDKRDGHKEEAKKRQFAIQGAKEKSQRKRMRMTSSSNDRNALD